MEFEATKARHEQILCQRQAVSLVKQEQAQRLEQNEANVKLAEAALNPVAAHIPVEQLYGETMRQAMLVSVK